jgi:hypothetical protein
MLRTLLINSTYECLQFIDERKLIKFIYKNKVEILSTWDSEFIYDKVKYPAVVKLIDHVKWVPRKIKFNRYGVFKRDQFVCQYCSAALTPNKCSIDHVIPRSLGGKNEWNNCVTSCYSCNNKKGNKTLEQTKMKLINKPYTPSEFFYVNINQAQVKHEDWDFYFKTKNPGNI